MACNRARLQMWHDAGVLPYNLNEYLRRLRKLDGNFIRPYNEIAGILNTTRGHATQIICWAVNSVNRYLNRDVTGKMLSLDESTYNILRRGGISNDQDLMDFLAGKREVRGMGKVHTEKIRRLLCSA